MASAAEREAYEQLQYYTLAHGDSAFIHQHVVDAWSAQQADTHTKSIALAFALIGLHLHFERGFSGREVQRAHMALASRRREWPRVLLPESRGALTVVDVMAAPAGAERDQRIDDWCSCVWQAYATQHARIAELLREGGYAPA